MKKCVLGHAKFDLQYHTINFLESLTCEKHSVAIKIRKFVYVSTVRSVQTIFKPNSIKSSTDVCFNRSTGSIKKTPTTPVFLLSHKFISERLKARFLLLKTLCRSFLFQTY